MSWTKAKDISRYQGNWQDTGEPIVMIKMSGGDDGLYMDSQAAGNYSGAIAAGRAVGGYHFAGGTNPEAEAAYFLKAMSPLAENDVYALDWEIQHPDPVGWCKDFMLYIYDQIKVWPLIYMNLNTLNSYDWSPVLTNCGLWLADWAVSPDANIPTTKIYVMQQYSDGPNYDHDAWFGSVDQFKKYGYHAPTPPAPNPEPVPAPSPQNPIAPAEPVINPTINYTSSTTSVPVKVTLPDLTNNFPTPKPPATTESMNWFQKVINWIRKLFKKRS